MKIIVGLGNPGREYENTRHNVGFEVVDALLNQISHQTGGQVNIKNPSYAEASAGRQNDRPKFKNDEKFNALVCRIGDLMLVKPQTYMNESGKSVAAILRFYKVDPKDLWVVHDDLDIVFGNYKIHWGKGPKIHNGVNDIEERLGTEEFWRVRVGVDSRGREIRNSSLRPDIAGATTGRQITNKLKSLIFKNSKHGKVPGRKYVLMKLSGDEKAKMDETVERAVKEISERIDEHHTSLISKS